MPPKGQGQGQNQGQKASGSSSKAAKKSNNAIDQPDEDPLVAVILADSYDDHYAPLTITSPRCLLPLANVPLLDYSIESATVSGVSHIYVLASSQSEKIRTHIRENLQSKLSSQSIGITVMSTPEATSEGDAMRELDARQVIRSDFILYRADSVCTFDLTKAVEEHKRRRKLDKDVVMTMCCMPVQNETPMRSEAVRPVHFVDPSNNQILHYEMQYRHPKRKASMPYEILRLDEKSGVDEIDIRYDLVESGVEICSIDVPPLFSENFDYQSFAIDFLPGILTSDLLDSKFFLEIYKVGYGGRARDTATYDAISKSILRRWTYPLTPASSAWLGEAYSERRGWKYIGEEGVKTDRSCTIGPGTMLGSRCNIGANSIIASSILGSDVKVGSSCQVADSHLHLQVHIGDGVQMKNCIVGQGAVILQGVNLGRGSLIGAGCVVGPNVTLKDGSRVGSKKKTSWGEESEEEEDDDDTEEVETPIVGQNARLGSQSKGVLWSNIWEDKASRQKGEDNDDDESDEDDDEDGVGMRNISVLRRRAIGYATKEGKGEESDEESSVSSIEGDSDLSDEEDGYDDETDAESRSAISSSAFSNIAGANVNLTLDEEADTKEEAEASNARYADFQLEAKASLQRALLEGHTVDNAAIELKTLRMASNVTLGDVRRVVVEVLLGKCNPTDAKAVQQLMSRWAKLITLVSSDDEVDAISLIQTYCADPEHQPFASLFVPLLKIFYNDDVFQEESMIAWWRNKESQTGSERRKELRTRAQGVIRYILESDDDDEEEEEED